MVATDLDRNGFADALARFARAAGGADIALVYYSGHGMQFAGTNYLFPVDATLNDAADVRFTLTPVERVLEALENVPGARVLVLDACRNNPVEADMKRRLATASGANRDAVLTRGFARLPATNGLLVAYATQANDVASDGSGRNSPFTSAFLKHVDTPDVDLRTMLFRVQDDVDRTTDHRQRPELSISLVGEIKLKTSAAGPSTPPGASTLDAAAQAWAAVKDSTRIADFEIFVESYAGSFFGRLAQSRIEELKKAQVAAARPSGQSTGSLAPTTAPAAPAPSTPPVQVAATPPQAAGPSAVGGRPDDVAVAAIREKYRGWTLTPQVGQIEFVLGIAVSPNGQRVVSGYGNGTIKVWEADSGRLLRTLRGHTDW